MANIAIDKIEQLAREYHLAQIIVFGFDGVTTNVATWGDTLQNASMAAFGANEIKKSWGWPENTQVESAKVKRLIDENLQLREELAKLKESAK